jgi:putative spermidine/putrescine transport system substrate-binding protein
LIGQAAIVGGVLAVGVRLAAGVAIASDSITFVAWSGTTQERQLTVWGESFIEQTGFTVVGGPTDYGKFKAMAEAGNLVWGIVEAEADFAYRAAARRAVVAGGRGFTG